MTKINQSYDYKIHYVLHKKKCIEEYISRLDIVGLQSTNSRGISTRRFHLDETRATGKRLCAEYTRGIARKGSYELSVAYGI